MREPTEDEPSDTIALYYEMRARDNFEETAEALHAIVAGAIEKQPSKPRHLYLDVERHRNEAGGFDHDAHELQRHFILDFLSPYLSAVDMPLMSVKFNHEQSDDLDDMLRIYQPPT